MPSRCTKIRLSMTSRRIVIPNPCNHGVLKAVLPLILLFDVDQVVSIVEVNTGKDHGPLDWMTINRFELWKKGLQMTLLWEKSV